MSLDTLAPILRKLEPAEVRIVLLELGKPALLSAWEREQQIGFAIDRWNSGERLHSVVKELRRRFGLSESTAYRRATEALSHQSRYYGNGTRDTERN